MDIYMTDGVRGVAHYPATASYTEFYGPSLKLSDIVAALKLISPHSD